MVTRVASAQLNQVIGDFAGNVDRIAQAAERSVAAGAQVLVTPELSITGRHAIYDSLGPQRISG